MAGESWWRPACSNVFLPPIPPTAATDTRGRVWWRRCLSVDTKILNLCSFKGQLSIWASEYSIQNHNKPIKNTFFQKLMWLWFRWLPQTFSSSHRFSAFWLRSKCSICSYQLNIWYGGHVPPSILNWFLQGDEVQELAPASSRVGLALQYRQDRPTSPLTPEDHQLIINLNISRSFLLDGEYCNSTKSSPFHCHHLSKNKLT